MKIFIKSLTGLLGLAVFLAIVIAVNMLLADTRIRKDLTQEKLYTLADGTRNLLANLPRDVTLKFYFSRKNEDAPIPLKHYGERILDLLNEYKLVAKNRITLELYDPKPDSDEEEWAQRYGLTGQPMGMMGGGENVYLGLVAVSGTKEASLPFFAPSQEPRLEYLITRMIAETTTEKKPTIGILSSLPAMGDFAAPPSMAQGREPWASVSELMGQYNVRPVLPQMDKIPEDIDTLLVIHPKDLTDDMLYLIDQFVLRSGRLIAFIDPVCLADAESGTPDPRGYMSARSDLNKLTKAWGFEMDGSQVVADPRAGTQVRFSTGQAERSMTWLTLRKGNLDSKDIVTGSLELMMVPFAGAFKGAPVEGLTAETLLQSSEDAGLMNALSSTMGVGAAAQDFVKADKPLPIALRLTGKFKTAFPDGRPVNPTETNAPAATAKEAPLKESVKDGVVVLVGDVDCIFDRFAVEQMNFFGRKVNQVSNDNINFLINLVEQMTGSDALIGLRSRDAFRRPFTRVITMEEKAAGRWREEETKLQQKLRDTQMRLQELQRTKDADQKFVMSPEQQRELEQFRKQQFETRKQLKAVRKSLRSEIEDLGLKLKLANMAFMPALVALIGILAGIRHRHRSSHG
ncbi:MAG: Gldg family protein [bacterium]